MPTVQPLNKVDILLKSRIYLLDRCNIIFNTVDLSKINNTIEDASKIRLGILALNLPEDRIDVDANQRILVGLTKLCRIYKQQSINQI